MHEIAEGIYIERDYPGVVLGALRIGSSVVMVDAPLRAQDQQSWRIDVANLGGGADKLLVMLDTHIDRTLGIRAMESRVVGHQRALEILNNRPTTARGQDFDAGADWEPYELPANIRWPVLDLTYSDKMTVYLDDDPVEISHQPGAHVAGSWLRYDSKKVLFVGDSVIIPDKTDHTRSRDGKRGIPAAALRRDHHICVGIRVSDKSDHLARPRVWQKICFIEHKSAKRQQNNDDGNQDDPVFFHNITLSQKIIFAGNCNRLGENFANICRILIFFKSSSNRLLTKKQ